MVVPSTWMALQAACMAATTCRYQHVHVVLDLDLRVTSFSDKYCIELQVAAALKILPRIYMYFRTLISERDLPLSRSEILLSLFFSCSYSPVFVADRCFSAVR